MVERMKNQNKNARIIQRNTHLNGNENGMVQE